MGSFDLPHLRYRLEFHLVAQTCESSDELFLYRLAIALFKVGFPDFSLAGSSEIVFASCDGVGASAAGSGVEVGSLGGSGGVKRRPISWVTRSIAL